MHMHMHTCSGSTASLALYAHGVLTVAAVGDSDVVLGACYEGEDGYEGWKAVELNRRHILADSHERKRIEGALLVSLLYWF